MHVRHGIRRTCVCSGQRCNMSRISSGRISRWRGGVGVGGVHVCGGGRGVRRGGLVAAARSRMIGRRCRWSVCRWVQPVRLSTFANFHDRARHATVDFQLDDLVDRVPNLCPTEAYVERCAVQRPVSVTYDDDIGGTARLVKVIEVKNATQG